jgi:hypothetical protein
MNLTVLSKNLGTIEGGNSNGKGYNPTKVVGLLIEVANADTVYRDLYLRRARQLLSATLDESPYRAIGSTEKEIEDLMRRSRSAVLQRRIFKIRPEYISGGPHLLQADEPRDVIEVKYESDLSPSNHEFVQSSRREERKKLVNTKLT